MRAAFTGCPAGVPCGIPGHDRPAFVSESYTRPLRQEVALIWVLRVPMTATCARTAAA